MRELVLVAVVVGIFLGASGYEIRRQKLELEKKPASGTKVHVGNKSGNPWDAFDSPEAACKFYGGVEVKYTLQMKSGPIDKKTGKAGPDVMETWDDVDVEMSDGGTGLPACVCPWTCDKNGENSKDGMQFCAGGGFGPTGKRLTKADPVLLNVLISTSAHCSAYTTTSSTTSTASTTPTPCVLTTGNKHVCPWYAAQIPPGQKAGCLVMESTGKGKNKKTTYKWWDEEGALPKGAKAEQYKLGFDKQGCAPPPKPHKDKDGNMTQGVPFYTCNKDNNCDWDENTTDSDGNTPAPYVAQPVYWHPVLRECVTNLKIEEDHCSKGFKASDD